MVTITNALLVMVSLFNAGLAVFMFRGNTRRATNLFLGVYFAALFIWPLALIGTQIGSSYTLWLYSTKVTYVAGLVIAASFYLFSIAYPEETFPTRFTNIAVCGVVLVYSLAEFVLPSFLVQSIVVTPTGNAARLDPTAYIVFATVFCLLYLGGIVRIIRKYRVASGIVRRRLLIIWVGVAITGIGGLYYDIFLASPFVNNFQYIWTGPLFNTVTAGLIVYAVLRLGFLNTKVILTELLIGLLWIFTFLRTLLAEASQERLFNGGLFVLSLIIGSLLVRSAREEIRQREEIENMALELEKTNERQDALLHFIGHEVKGFLTKDEGAFAALDEGDLGPLPEALKPFVRQALAESRHGADSVSSILKAANLKRGTVSYTMASFDLKSLVAQEVERERRMAEQKGLSLNFVSDDASYYMVGDSTQIQEHVLRNLIDNAINYTPSGSIEVSLRKEGGELVCTVKDTGVGVSEDDKKKLFTEGGHGKDSQRINAHSTGYGLYIVRHIVEAHKGTVQAESDGPGKGAVFTVRFREDAMAAHSREVADFARKI